MMMFKGIRESLLMCRAEIWGWKEQEEARKIYEMRVKSGQVT
jgi:hypothetical protein